MKVFATPVEMGLEYGRLDIEGEIRYQTDDVYCKGLMFI
jgi:hypothetical protein